MEMGFTENGITKRWWEIMARYPELSNLINIPTKELRDMYNEIQRWGATLLNELDSRDALVDNRPSTTIQSRSNIW